MTQNETPAKLAVALVDVFGERPLTGNPLAVVELETPLDDDTLRRIAGEFNQAETTFLMRSERAEWKLRSFTAAGAEVFGAGHNALGAWIWLGARGMLGDLSRPTAFHQEIGNEVLPIVMSKSDGRIHGIMRQSAMTLGSTLGDCAPLAAALGLSSADIVTEPAARVVSTGVAHLMVRVANHATVDAADPDAKALLAVLKEADGEGCYVYQLSSSGREAYARFFNPTVGLWEDSATGTAAGPLAAYLGHEGLLKKNKLAITQGAKMGRPSVLSVELTPVPALSGSGVVVLEGTLHL